jgi:hypothetical protein
MHSLAGESAVEVGGNSGCRAPLETDGDQDCRCVMCFAIKSLVLVLASCTLFGTAYAESDYAACRTAEVAYHETARFYRQMEESGRAINPDKIETLHRKYAAYREAESKWANDLRWMGWSPWART